MAVIFPVTTLQRERSLNTGQSGRGLAASLDAG